MILLLTKAKNIVSLGASILKSEVLNITNQRAKFMVMNFYSNTLNSHTDFLSTEMKFSQSSGDPKDFGKIISLDLEEAEPVAETESRSKRKRPKRGARQEKVFDSIGIEEAIEGVLKEPVEESVQEEKKEQSSKRKLNYNVEMKQSITFRAMEAVKSKKLRNKNQEILLEGRRLIYEAIQAGVKPKSLFFSRVSDIENLGVSDDVELCRISYKELQLWSNVVNCQGIVGIFHKPDLNVPKADFKSIPLTVILDNVRDPGNLGTILRIVGAVGCEKLILTKGCVDIWEPKVLRSAVGAHFNLPAVEYLSWSAIKNEMPEDSKIVLADCENVEDNSNYIKQSNIFRCDVNENLQLCCYNQMDYTQQKIVLVLGGETFGLSKEAQELAVARQGVRVFIPVWNNIESLNNGVALAIISYEIKRQIECSKRISSQKGEDSAE